MIRAHAANRFLETSMLFAVKVLMTLATLCYAIGYASRRRDNRLHRRTMAAGFLLTLAMGVVWIAASMGFGDGLRAAYWLIRAAGTPERAHWVVIVHRVLVGVTLATLAAQVVTGLRRDPLHTRLYGYAIALWLTTYVSSMFIFT